MNYKVLLSLSLLLMSYNLEDIMAYRLCARYVPRNGVLVKGCDSLLEKKYPSPFESSLFRKILSMQFGPSYQNNNRGSLECGLHVNIVHVTRNKPSLRR
jgi:hypothetical protein